jgi:eukaryotic-like serine/threonine-protein kinase
LQGRYAEAAERFQDALKIRPSASLYSNLGTVLFAQGLYAPSAAAFERALAMGGAANHPVFWGNLADAYRQLPDAGARAREHYDRAIALVDEALAHAPGDATLRSRRALYLAKRGACPRAEVELAELSAPTQPATTTATTPEVAAALTPYTRFRLAVALEICGHRRRALGELERALEAGFAAAEIANDPELRALRADPGYHRMVQRRAALSRPASRR